MIYDPSRRAQLLRDRIFEAMSPEEREEYSNKEASMERLEATRICEKCGTPRHIVVTTDSSRAFAGNLRTSSSGSARCKCPETNLNDLDKRAIQEARAEQ